MTLNTDGSFSYTPSLHYVGADSFTYEDDNGQQTSSPATVSLTVTNSTPGTTNDLYALPNGATFNGSAASGVLANDGDLDGDTLTASLSTEPTHGSLTLNSDGSFSYTPNSGWVSVDTFSYTTSDGIATSSPATVSLHTQYSVLSAVDETKVPVDTINVSRQILSDPFNSAITSPLPAGGSGGTTISAAPADGAPNYKRGQSRMASN